MCDGTQQNILGLAPDPSLPKTIKAKEDNV